MLVLGLAFVMLAEPAMKLVRPSYLDLPVPAVRFVDESGALIGYRGVKMDTSVPYDELPTSLLQAVLATEDQRFSAHFGLDAVGLVRAAFVNLHADGVVQGGSTVTQQLAKLLFLSSERTAERKLREVFLALWLESRLTKADILKHYLDRAYMGSGVYGVEAASQHYFGVSVRHINLKQAALLAGLLKAPSRFSPLNNPSAAEARARLVLQRMHDVGFLDGALLQQGLLQPLQLAALPHREPTAYLDAAYRDVMQLMDSGLVATHSGALRQTLHVQTSFQRFVQTQAESALLKALRHHESEIEGGDADGVLQGAVVVQKPNGLVVAMVGGRPDHATDFNRAVDAQRQPGSAFKPFVYTLGLLRGLNPHSLVIDTPVEVEGWSPENYTRRFSGAMDLEDALAHSINTVPVRLAQLYGLDPLIRVAHAMGVRADLRATPSLPLGTSEVSLLDLTSSYAVFANQGKHETPSPLVRIQTASGRVLWERSSVAGRSVLPLAVVADMNAMLAKAVRDGTGQQALFEGHSLAGKTGTSSDYRDAWFVGYTSHLVTGVWVGRDDGRPMGSVTGGTRPAQVFADVMQHAHQTLPPVLLAGVSKASQLAKAGSEGSLTTGSAASLFAPLYAARREERRLTTADVLALIGQNLRNAREGALGSTPRRRATAQQ